MKQIRVYLDIPVCRMCAVIDAASILALDCEYHQGSLLFHLYSPLPRPRLVKLNRYHLPTNMIMSDIIWNGRYWYTHSIILWGLAVPSC